MYKLDSKLQDLLQTYKDRRREEMDWRIASGLTKAYMYGYADGESACRKKLTQLARACHTRKVHEDWPALGPLIRKALKRKR